MQDYTISEYIKALRKERNYTMVNLANECGIGLRGFNKWLKKTDREWSVDSLIILSKILDFEIKISGGIIKIMKNTNTIQNENTMLIENKEVYDTFKNFGDYSIVHLYTPNTNLNFDETPDLLEDFFIFSNVEECMKEFPDSSPVKMYGLLNNNTNCIELERLVSIYPYKAINYYYSHLAPVISYTDDNYEIVGVFEDNTKLVRAGVILEEYNGFGNHEIKSFTNNLKDDDCIPGFVSISEFYNHSKDFGKWSESVEFLYSDYDLFNTKTIGYRYFDRNRNEIFNDDLLVNKGFSEDILDMFNEDDFRDIEKSYGKVNNYHRIEESLRVEMEDNKLGFEIKGIWFSLNELNLLKWQKVI